MIDDPYKLVRDILVNSTEVTKVIPSSNIRNAEIPSNLITQPPYIRISVLDIPDVAYGDGQVYASGVYIQIDIWQKSGLFTMGNIISRLLKAKDFRFVDMMEPGTENVTDTLTLFRDSRRYFYTYQLNEKEIY